MPAHIMLSQAQPEKTDVHALPVMQYPTPTRDAQAHPVIHAAREAAARALVSKKSAERET